MKWFKIILVVLGLMLIFPYYKSYAQPMKTLSIILVQEPREEYLVGDRIYVKVQVPNCSTRVEYRAVLWASDKGGRELWSTYPYYYGKWQPYGKVIFPITWIAQTPGVYRLTIYMRRLGNKVPYESYIATGVFRITEGEVVNTFTPGEYVEESQNNTNNENKIINEDDNEVIKHNTVYIMDIPPLNRVVAVDTKFQVPQTVMAMMNNGSRRKLGVNWVIPNNIRVAGGEFIIDTPGVYMLQGRVSGYDGDVLLTIQAKMPVEIYWDDAEHTAKAVSINNINAGDHKKIAFYAVPTDAAGSYITVKFVLKFETCDGEKLHDEIKVGNAVNIENGLWVMENGRFIELKEARYFEVEIEFLRRGKYNMELYAVKDT